MGGLCGAGKTPRAMAQPHVGGKSGDAGRISCREEGGLRLFSRLFFPQARNAEGAGNPRQSSQLPAHVAGNIATGIGSSPHRKSRKERSFVVLPVIALPQLGGFWF